MADKKEHEKYADEQVRDRTLSEAMGRLRLALFVAALGPMSCVLIHLIQFTPEGNNIRYGILATIPAALLLLVINYARLPGAAKVSSKALGVLALTLGLAASTYLVARMFSLLPT
jgi:hypothetical protein